VLDLLNQIETTGIAELSAAVDPAALEAWRIAYLGSSGKLKTAMGGLKDVPKDQKPAVGAKLNAVKTALEEAYNARKGSLGAAAPKAAESIDMTEPGLIDVRTLGREHIISRVRNELVDVFGRMGFEVAEGPELEDDEHNFVKLNIPARHPARDPIDNFYVDPAGRSTSRAGCFGRRRARCRCG
jgi:phenylalanyl-tRNA synthetase alpha chain